MCRCSDAELNCVIRWIWLNPEFRQFEIGISTRRYLPPSGTAGFERSFVNGNSRVPAPPPRITARTFRELRNFRPVFIPSSKNGLHAPSYLWGVAPNLA